MGLGKTEWEDILIEKGIIQAPIQPESEQHPDTVYDLSNRFANDEENEMFDEVDELFADEDNFVQEYKAKRFQQLQRQQMGAFGSVNEISRNEFVQEVTEASKHYPVLVYLYQTHKQACQILGKWLHSTAAPANPRFKFVQIMSTRCIPNYPDDNLPTLILYRQGNVQKQLTRVDIKQANDLLDQIKEAETELLNK